MEYRPATAAEIIEHNSFNIKHGWKVQYRHFVRELYNPRAKNGVSHRQYSRSKLRVIDDKPMVMYQGKLVEVTGEVITLPNGREIVSLLRIKSDHLK